MSNPNNGLWWLAALVCIWPLITFLLGILLATAFQRGWIHIRLPEKGPRIDAR
jgi:hypothetical protein